MLAFENLILNALRFICHYSMPFILEIHKFTAECDMLATEEGKNFHLLLLKTAFFKLIKNKPYCFIAHNILIKLKIDIFMGTNY